MAIRRMFSKTITCSSGFLMMPPTTRLLYYDLGMSADDDGFCEHYVVMKMTDASPDDLRVLEARGFVKVFDDRVLIIKQWKENNYLRSDRYTPSKYLNLYEKELKELKGEPVYTIGIPNGNQLATQDRIGKDRIGKDINYVPAHEVRVSPYKRVPLEKATQIQRIVYHLEDTLKTRIVNWGKQAAAIKKTLQAGYSEQEILRTIDHMATVDEFFLDKGFDMVTVSNNISRFKALAGKGANG